MCQPAGSPLAPELMAASRLFLHEIEGHVAARDDFGSRPRWRAVTICG
jgi:hypothetical protein